MKPNHFHQLNLKKMYRKAWVVESLDSIADVINGVNVGLHFDNLIPAYSTFQDEETNDLFFIDNDMSLTEHPDIDLEYHDVNQNQPLISTSFNFIGTIPHRPK